MGKSPELRLEARQQHRIEATVADDVIQRLVAAGVVPPTALGAPAVAPPPIQAPAPAGMLRCNAEKGHPDYAEFSKTGTRREKCPKCDAEQHREARAEKKKQKAQGTSSRAKQKATQGTNSRGSAARRNGSNAPRT
jgi:hypothetical protein